MNALPPEPELIERVFALLRWQLVGSVVLSGAVAWVLNLALQRKWTSARQTLMALHQNHMLRALLISTAMSVGVEVVRWSGLLGDHALALLGFVTVVAWLVGGLRVGRLYVFEWLFANSTAEGVPVLLVDLFTFGASLLLLGALVHSVFLVEVTSLLATSAVASVVLGLALQDTLGHLFAGISLQLDRPFKLGDWVEVRSGSERISGQVLEVSWRATLLLAIGEELITIPNKVMAQGLVLNFSGRERPFVRSHLFRLPLDAPLEVAKEALKEAARQTEGIVAAPASVPLVIETTESWVAVKMITFITDFGRQYSIGDAFQARALELLAEQGISLASTRIQVEPPPPALRPTGRAA